MKDEALPLLNDEIDLFFIYNRHGHDYWSCKNGFITLNFFTVSIIQQPPVNMLNGIFACRMISILK